MRSRKGMNWKSWLEGTTYPSQEERWILTAGGNLFKSI